MILSQCYIWYIISMSYFYSVLKGFHNLIDIIIVFYRQSQICKKGTINALNFTYRNF